MNPGSEIRFEVNSRQAVFTLGVDIAESDTLAFVLREKLHLTGTKVSCNEGACGACTVLIDGRAALSCMSLAVEAQGRSVTTIEGLGPDDPLVRAFADQHEPGLGTALQCGCCTPGFIMAARGLLNENPRPDRGEIRTALSGNICRCGCYPAIERAVQRVSGGEADGEKLPAFTPRVVRLHTGQYRSRVDGLSKACGSAEYIDDITLKARFPGLLYARYLRSPYAHAVIRGYDASAARALPGVHAVLAFDDPEVRALWPFHGGWTDGASSADRETQFFRMYQDRRALEDRVRWVGDEAGIIVAAESENAADEAIRLLRVEWEVLPFALSVADALAPGAAVIHPEINPSGNAIPWDPFGGPYASSAEPMAENLPFQKGDVEQAFAEAEVTAEGATTYCDTTQSSLDPWSCVSHWTAEGLTVVSNTYEADQLRIFLSQMLGLPKHRVRCIAPYVGGSFGRGDTGEQPFFLTTALLSRRTGRPVKFRHTRRESFQNGRTIVHGEVRIAARRDGSITGISLKQTANVGAYLDHALAAVKFIPRECIETQCHNVPAVRMEAHAAYTNRMSASCMRGIGNIQFNFLLGLGVDVLAEKLGMDPVRLVTANFGDHLPMPNRSLQAVLAEGARRIGWEQKRHPAGEGPALEGGRRRGLGMSFHNEWHTMAAERRRGPVSIVIKLDTDGTVLLTAPTIETGPGSNSVAVHVLSETLGIPVESIRWICVTDTDTTPKDQVQTDSAVSIIFAEAVSAAAREARERLFALASPLLGSPAAGLTLEDGQVRDGMGRGIGVGEVVSRCGCVPLSIMHTFEIPVIDRGTPFRASFAEVEVDMETGELTVVRLVVLDDMGTVLSPAGAEGQAIGGQVQGLGEALTESMIYDPATGRPLNFNWIDYPIHAMLDFPRIEPVPLEVWTGAGEYGASGMGEGVVTCTPRAIANALYNAAGVRVDDLPLTTDKIQAAIARKTRGRAAP